MSGNKLSKSKDGRDHPEKELPSDKELDISELYVTQESLRKEKDDLCTMAAFVRGGGKFTEETMREGCSNRACAGGIKGDWQPIRIIQMKDDKALFLWDGHHRAVSVVLGGRHVLHPEEYVMHEMDYDYVNTVNPSVGYVTPFHPLKEVRAANFVEFKRKALKMSGENAQKAEKFIRENRESYVHPRSFDTIDEMIQHHNYVCTKKETDSLCDCDEPNSSAGKNSPNSNL